NVLPTIDTPNQVLDASFCNRVFGAGTGLSEFATQSLSAYARELGGTLPENAFTEAEMNKLSRLYTSRAMSLANETHVATTKAYSFEAARLSAKLGADHPMAVALKTQADAGAETSRVMASSAEVAAVDVPTPVDAGSTVSGRFVNSRGQGQEGYLVGLVRANGSQVEIVGTTDAVGAFSVAFDPKE